MSKWTRTALLLLGIGALLVAASPVLSDDTEKAAMEAPAGIDPAAMEAAWAKAGAPGENHEFLARLEGDWTFESKMWMDPSAPPMESQGAAEKTMILGGRYLQEESSGEAMGQPFHGRALTAFDNVSGEFAGTWIDNMGTGILISRGSRDGDSLTLIGEMTDPMSQQQMKLRMVTRIVDEDHHVFDYYVTMPGIPELKQMVIEYTRKSTE
ncbi:MAG: DUF1579 domain-containing protein [Thermoanaerobaculia bacterium]